MAVMFGRYVSPFQNVTSCQSSLTALPTNPISLAWPQVLRAAVDRLDHANRPR